MMLESRCRKEVTKHLCFGFATLSSVCVKLFFGLGVYVLNSTPEAAKRLPCNGAGGPQGLRRWLRTAVQPAFASARRECRIKRRGFNYLERRLQPVVPTAPSVAW